MFSFNPRSYTVTEGHDAFVTVTLNRTENLDVPASLIFNTVSGTADASVYTLGFNAET